MATSTGYHVIVGGLGALGKTMQKTLLAQGKKVRVIDARSPVEATTRLVDGSIDYHQYYLPVLQKEKLQQALKGAETVYGMVTGDVVNGTAADAVRANEHGTKQLVEICKQVGVPKYIHASSAAVTNQMLDHYEEDETVPLPAWETYKIPYDISKRRGEEIALMANDGDTGNFQTVALRLGGLIADTTDYMTRTIIQRPGEVTGLHTAPTDFISANDVCRAMLKASQKLDSSDNQVNGRAIYVTKSKDNRGYSGDEIAKVYAQILDWNYSDMNRFLLSGIMNAGYVKAYLKDFLVMPTDETTAAFPFHLMMYASTKKALTFDNALAKELLEFTPKDTLEDMVSRVCADIRLENPEMFILNPRKI